MSSNRIKFSSSSESDSVHDAHEKNHAKKRKREELNGYNNNLEQTAKKQKLETANTRNQFDKLPLVSSQSIFSQRQKNQVRTKKHGKKKSNKKPTVSKTESLAAIKSHSKKKQATPSIEKYGKIGWKGSLPTKFLSEEESQARFAEYIEKIDDAGPGKRFGETLYASKDGRRYFRSIYKIDEPSDDEELMSTGIYFKLT